MTFGLVLICLLFAVVGVLLSAPLCLIPALHVYNVIGLLVLVYLPLSAVFDPLFVTMLMFGLLVGYAMMNTLTSVYFSTPDDSTVFIVLPAQKYLTQGRAHEAVILSAVGGLIGVFFLAVLVPLTMGVLGTLRELLAPHLFWILAVISAYILMSEWPKDFSRGQTKLQRLAEGWSTLIPGLFTFFAAGLFGFILMRSQIIPAHRGFQTLLPAFVGLFAVPWVLTNMVSRMDIPEQHIAESVDIKGSAAARGGIAGCIGGILAAFFPAVTGGTGGLLAGHATAQRDERSFLLSQGASKVVYYVGAAFLLFIPGLELTRGTMAIMVNLFYTPQTTSEFFLVAGVIALCGFIAFLLLIQMSKVTINLVERVPMDKLNIGVLVIIHAIVLVVTSWQGLLVMWIGASIGLIPVMYHSRRLNCMGVLLFPLMLELGGAGAGLAVLLGLA
ncbi:MAG: tripartite tricarboxylate transporter permease [Candidatus Natronoplasma sp.]